MEGRPDKKRLTISAKKLGANDFGVKYEPPCGSNAERSRQKGGSTWEDRHQLVK